MLSSSVHRVLRNPSVVNAFLRNHARTGPLRVSARCFAREVRPDEVVHHRADHELQSEETKPLTNLPFAKDLFLGKFDKTLLVYPEVLEKEELDELNQMVQPIEKFFYEDLDSKSIDINAKIPDEVMNTIKELGLFGQQIPYEYGGLGLNATQFARLAEITATDGAIAVTLAAHQSIGLKGILIAGTDAQKAQYLPKLATGEHVAAFALTEPSSGSDAASIQTKARLSEDGKTFYLNGGKIWISNGGIADVFTVFAKTEVTGPDGVTKEKVTAFIVERAFGGLTNGKPEDKLGIRGSNTTEIYFEDCPVPIENVLGEVGGGFKVAMNILNSGRFSMGSSVAGILKRLIGWTLEHASTRSQFGTKLKDFEMIKEKFAKMAIQCYAMESMAYMTAGTLDTYAQPDCSVEAAMVKVFSSESSWDCVSECLQILGGLGYMKDYPYERYLRDSRILMIFEGTNEILRLYVALTGIQHAGKELKDMVKKLKDPLNNLGFILKTAGERGLRKAGNQHKLKLKLDKEVHPELAKQAGDLEARLGRFKGTVEEQLRRYNKDIINQQLVLKRMADISIDLYGITCVLARCSRSLSIGLKHCDHESVLARTFVKQAIERIDTNLNKIETGRLENGDEEINKISDFMVQHGGYVAAHPLERNW